MRVYQKEKSSETTLLWLTPPLLAGHKNTVTNNDLGEVAKYMYPIVCILSEVIHRFGTRVSPPMMVGLTMTSRVLQNFHNWSVFTFVNAM